MNWKQRKFLSLVLQEPKIRFKQIKKKVKFTSSLIMTVTDKVDNYHILFSHNIFFFNRRPNKKSIGSLESEQVLEAN